VHGTLIILLLFKFVAPMSPIGVMAAALSMSGGAAAMVSYANLSFSAQVYRDASLVATEFAYFLTSGDAEELPAKF
jgi:hypothetical protein